MTHLNQQILLSPEDEYLRSDNKSGYKGVSPFRGKWKAKLTKEGVDYYLGIFSSKEQAALMYDMAAKKHFEKFAALNFELDLG